MDYEFWIEDYVAGGLPTAFNCSCTCLPSGRELALKKM
jgi:hypothetical protein